MAKVEVRAWFKEIGQVETVGQNDFQVQNIMMIVPGFKDEFQGINRPDEPWLVQVKGDNIKKLNLSKKDEGTRCKATCYVEGYAAETKEGKPFSGFRVTLHKFEVINVNA